MKQKVKQLKAEAKALKIPRYSRMRKAELLEAISAHKNYDPADDSRKSYDLAVNVLHDKLASFRNEQIGDCTLYLGDCREILPLLPVADAVVTDPPYGLDYGYLSYDDTPENLVELVRTFLPLARAKAARVVVFPGVHNLSLYPKATWCVSWSWRSTSHFGLAGYNMWQPILLYGDDIKDFGNVNGLTKADSVHFADSNGIGFLGESVKDHPCPKPEKLMRWVLQRFSRPSSMIIDPFMGSGTTGVAAVKLGRKFIGIELEPRYHSIACRRIEEAYKQGDFFVPKVALPQAKQLPLTV